MNHVISIYLRYFINIYTETGGSTSLKPQFLYHYNNIYGGGAQS